MLPLISWHEEGQPRKKLSAHDVDPTKIGQKDLNDYLRFKGATTAERKGGKAVLVKLFQDRFCSSMSTQAIPSPQDTDLNRLPPSPAHPKPNQPSSSSSSSTKAPAGAAAFKNAPKEGDHVLFDMGDKSLAKGKTGRVDWHQGTFRYKTWEDDDGDGDFAWACTIKEDGADETSTCYLQEIPWHPLTKCIPCSSEIGENDYAKGAVLCDKCKRLKTGEDFNDDGDSS